MESSLVFSDPCRPIDIPDYSNAVAPVQVPVFSDRPDGQSAACTATT